MGCHNDIGHREQGAGGVQRLGLGHVQTGGNLALLQCLNESGPIHNGAAGAVRKDGRGLHHGEFLGAHAVAGFHGDDLMTGGFQHFNTDWVDDLG